MNRKSLVKLEKYDSAVNMGLNYCYLYFATDFWPYTCPSKSHISIVIILIQLHRNVYIAKKMHFWYKLKLSNQEKKTCLLASGKCIGTDQIQQISSHCFVIRYARFKDWLFWVNCIPYFPQVLGKAGISKSCRVWQMLQNVASHQDLHH